MKAPAFCHTLKAWRVVRWADRADRSFRSDEAARIIRANELHNRQQADRDAKRGAKAEIKRYVDKLAMAASLNSTTARERLQQLCFDEIGEFAAKTAREALAELGGADG
ncbi:MAG: hypothetical protein KGK02_04570 [Rhodospirillales bacterium]|nr:hypothetical protein [Rhodospirillales bacterium]